RAVQADFNHMVEADNLPWVRSPQPVVRKLVLPAIANRLFEDAVFIAKAISHPGQLLRCDRFDKAARQAAQTAVAEARVRLLFQQLVPVDLRLGTRFGYRGI